METLTLKPERQAELEEYARRRGQDPAAALDDALATYLEWERQDFEEAVESIRHGYEDVKAGRTRPAAEWMAEMRRKHDPSWPPQIPFEALVPNPTIPWMAPWVREFRWFCVMFAGQRSARRQVHEAWPTAGDKPHGR
jgi:predicted transcriptional regulator